MVQATTLQVVQHAMKFNHNEQYSWARYVDGSMLFNASMTERTMSHPSAQSLAPETIRLANAMPHCSLNISQAMGGPDMRRAIDRAFGMLYTASRVQPASLNVCKQHKPCSMRKAAPMTNGTVAAVSLKPVIGLNVYLIFLFGGMLGRSTAETPERYRSAYRSCGARKD